MSDARKIVVVRIEGYVQGVGFRAFVEREANNLCIQGWVRNRVNGDVEALFAGKTGDVDALIDACRRGPVHARVVNLMVRSADAEELTDLSRSGFHLRPTI